jgi:hypothetical protein
MPKTTEHQGTTRKAQLNQIRVDTLEQLRKRYPPLKENQVKVGEMHVKLRNYHDELLYTLKTIATERLTDEIKRVVDDVERIDEVNRPYTWSKVDEERLNKLNADAKRLPIPQNWFWARSRTVSREYTTSRGCSFGPITSCSSR